MSVTPAIVAAKDEKPVELAPSGAWEVDYADDSCALRRGFGEPGKEAWLEIRRFSPGDEFQITIASKAYPIRRTEPHITYGADEDAYEPIFPYFTNFGDGVEGVVFSDTFRTTADKKKRPGFDTGWSEEERTARETAVNAIMLDKSFGDALLLKTGSLKSPMKALGTCTDDLLTRWGLDPIAHKALSRPAKLGKDESLTAAMRGADSGTQMRILMIVGADGKPTSCTVKFDRGDADDGKAACEKLMPATTFEPALDASGQPVASYFSTSIVRTMRTQSSF